MTTSPPPAPIGDSGSAEPNPILEAKVASIDELMARDPLGLTAAEKVEIIKYHRAMRIRYEAGEAKPAKAPKAAAAKPGKKPVPSAMTIDELFGGEL